SGKAFYCGKPDDPAAEQRYHKALAEWMAAGRQLPADPNTITVKELLARFWTHAEQYYRTLTDGRAKELEQFRLALRPMKELYGNTPATEFGPRALKTVRQKMVEMGWCRSYTNKQVNRVRHVFKWAVGDELIPSSVLNALQAVPGLKRGRSDAPDLEAVKPVPMEMVEAIQPYVSRQVWAMIQLQLFTAARAGEIARIRPMDIDRGDEKLPDGRRAWICHLKEHKTAWHGHERKIYIGPRAQQVLAPFLLRDPNAYCFSPTEAEAERREHLHDERTTPLSCGNVPGSNRTDDPERTAGERYTTDSYRRAIARACDQAFPAPEPLAKCEDETIAKWEARLTTEQKAELATWQKAHRWHPHQLRHNAATELRREFGIEAARIILGHRSAAITEVYAEQDERQAIEAIMKVG
ncbi:MAG TPA: site-specific integrase, partial [Planctomycetota bacterium]|nr:site-specific integrase [Planctomycetota bacterium]